MANNSKPSINVGTVINEKYVVLEFIERGGMGEVYRAHQTNLKRDVAIKIISNEWLESLEDDEEEIEIGLQRFRNEVQSMAQIRHPNIVQIYDSGSFSIRKDDTITSVEFLAMEYVPGGTLRSTMSEDGFYPEEDLTREWLINYFLPVLEGVKALHGRNIIHRDLKPGNVLLDNRIPKITDFGLARSSGFKPVTQSVDIKGTPPYMSPEHFHDLRRADHRADIYSLGKILFEAIDGKIGPETLPFKSARLRKSDTPFFNKLDRVIHKATAEDKSARFSSVEKLQTAILKVLQTEVRDLMPEDSIKGGKFDLLSSPKWVWTGIVTAIILVLAMTLWHFFGEPDKSTEVLMGKPSEPLSDIGTADNNIKSTLTGKDGATLHFITGGEFFISTDMEKDVVKTVNINSFFMDETEVTNHQYIEFLNKVLARITVEGHVVKGNGNVWLSLGMVTKEYEPIVFRDGKFSVKDPAFHSHPIVRVTGHGATAYAKYYGRRLPADFEWLYAMTTKSDKREESLEINKETPDSVGHMGNMHEQTQATTFAQQDQIGSPVSVTHFKPNTYGIRGLGGNVNEWSIGSIINSSPKSEEAAYIVLPDGISRHPWEAFKNVGFRTAVDISK
ncbi:bifunctional serine/threonine-protein kinase/formylglycine-generating enzyme family protein [Thermodesulfobacteriota bacterium]